MNSNQQQSTNQYNQSAAMSIVNNQLVFHPCIQGKSQNQPNGVIVSWPNNVQTQLMCDTKASDSYGLSQANAVQNHQQNSSSQFSIPIQLSGSGTVPLDLSSLMQGGCLPAGCLPIQLSNNNSHGSFNPQLGINQQDQQQNFQLSYNTIAVTSSSSQINQNISANSKSNSPNKSIKTPQRRPTQNKRQNKRTCPDNKIDESQEKFKHVAVQTDFDYLLNRQQVIVVPPKNCTCNLKNTGGNINYMNNNGTVVNSNRRKPKIKKDQGNFQNHQSDNADQEEDDEEDEDDDDPTNTNQPMYDNRGRPFSYKCQYCPKRFSLNSRLVAHTRCHTGIRPFTCLQCGYSFTQRSYLNRHAAVHKQERPFTCDTCQKTYKHYGSLANHRKLHNNSSNSINNNNITGDNNTINKTESNTTGPTAESLLVVDNQQQQQQQQHQHQQQQQLQLMPTQQSMSLINVSSLPMFSSATSISSLQPQYNSSSIDINNHNHQNRFLSSDNSNQNNNNNNNSALQYR